MVIMLSYTLCTLNMKPEPSMKKITDIWYSKHPLRWILLPFSYLYLIGYFIHRLIYKTGIKKITKFNVPIIVVGNITVGGTGKTPLTIKLSEILQQQGYNPGIVSRGYKGTSKSFPKLVTDHSDPVEVGEEAALMAMRTKCPVAIGPQRVKAINLLLQNFSCDIILCDDGLQHHAIKKDIEIALIDGERKLGNQLCLPAGPLREPKKRLKSVDFVVMHERRLTSHYSMALKVDEIYNLQNEYLKLEPQDMRDMIIHAVAGIGNPMSFFTSLRLMGLTINEHVFPDHHIYRKQDFAFLKPNEIMIMTEKDAIKCKKFAEKNFWVLSVCAVMNSKFTQDFLSILETNDF